MIKKLLLVITFISLIGCASVKQNMINEEAGSGINSWAVISLSELNNINNDTTEVEDTSFFAKLESQIKTIDEMMDDNKDKNLINSLKFDLVGEYGLSIKDRNKADGLISINTSTDYLYSGLTYGTIYVKFLTKDKELIAQIKISNKSVGAYKKDMKSMTDLTAKKINKFIKSLK